MSWIKDGQVYLTFNTDFYRNLDRNLSAIDADKILSVVLHEYSTTIGFGSELFRDDLAYRIKLMPIHRPVFIEARLYAFLCIKMVFDQPVDNNITLLKYLEINHFSNIKPFVDKPHFME